MMIPRVVETAQDDHGKSSRTATNLDDLDASNSEADSERERFKRNAFIRSAMYAKYALANQQMMFELGRGPMRFDPPQRERPFDKQYQDLTSSEQRCVELLKQRWQHANPEATILFSDFMILRFARCSPCTKPFDLEASWKVMNASEVLRRASLSAADMEQQLKTKTLFPVPGLKTKDGLEMFYMRPSRYFPRKTSSTVIIDNLAYCMNAMYEKEIVACNGIGFLAYMEGWELNNFSTDYCYQFMQMLQGRTLPVQVKLFLIVKPPNWFHQIWTIMRPMLSRCFRRKVVIVSDMTRLGRYLEAGYENFLPDEVSGGNVNTDQLVEDFIRYRKYVEGETSKNEIGSHKEAKWVEMLPLAGDADASKDPVHEDESPTLSLTVKECWPGNNSVKKTQKNDSRFFRWWTARKQ